MKKILLLIIIVNLIPYCSPSNKKQPISIVNRDTIFQEQNPEKIIKQKDTTKLSKQDKQKNIEEIERVQNEVKYLYYELLKFKDDEDFKQYGFPVHYKYHKWLKKIEILKASTSIPLLMIDYLQSLGLRYAITKGKETEFTVEMKETIEILFTTE